jgi:uncharacterized ion transporter superfamily protein YfcC
MKKKRQIPHTYVIVFFIIVFAAILTWFVPGGEYNKTGKNEVIPDSFHFTDSSPQTWQIFSALFKGFEKQAHIIIFILMIGGAFWIMNDSKAIDVGIYSFLKFTRKLEKKRFFKIFGVENIIIILIMLMFSLFGAIFGMSEETIAFIIIFVPLAISMGYDSIVGVSMCFIAAGLGFAGALLNPFTIGIAQGLSNLPLFSGIEYRFFCWIVINVVGIGYVLRYAKKVKANPKSSVVYENDAYWRKDSSAQVQSIAYQTPRGAWVSFLLILVSLIVYSIQMPLTTMKIGNSSATIPIIPVLTGIFVLTGILSLRKSAHFFILNLLMFTIFFLIIGVMGYGWYVMKIAALFLVMGIIAGISMGKSPNDIVKLFLEGAKDIMPAALIVGLAGGIIVILEDGKVVDTLLFYVSKTLGNFGNVASLSLMYIIQTLINLVIPSGSAKAALTMPIMSQFSDLINLSRQATVVAFQFGDGFTNFITPTSGVLLGVLGVAKIPYEKWVKWVTPFIIILILLGFLLLIPTVTMKLNGF